MARAARNKTRRGAKKSVSVDLSNVGKAFEAGEEYLVEVAECTLEEGQAAPYFNIKLKGVEDDFQSTYLYHTASTAEQALWRLRPLLEAFGIDIPDGPMDLGPEDFIGKQAMCSTFLDRYEGGSRVKPDEFWPADGSKESSEETEFDLDELNDEQVEALAEAMGVKGRTIAAKRKGLAAKDADELAEAFAELDSGEEGSGEEIDIDELEDSEIEALAEALEVKGRNVAAKRKALKKVDADELAEAYEALETDEKSGDSSKVDPEEVKTMNEDELEDLVETHELDVDLDDHKTLKKKRSAVLDALEEADLLDD